MRENKAIIKNNKVYQYDNVAWGFYRLHANVKIYKFFILCKIVKNSNEGGRERKKAAVSGWLNH